MNKLRKKLWIGIFTLFFICGAFTSYAIFYPKRNIPVLMYHFILPDSEAGGSSLNVSVSNFERQMHFLKMFKFRPISVEAYYAIKTGTKKPQGREVLITFDDGHRSYRQYALHILERYQIPSVNFLIWDHMNDKQWRDYMTLEEVKQIANHPLVTLGAHTMSHRNLSQLSTEEAWFEIKESKDKLEIFFKRPIDYFCYPEGSFSAETMQLVQRAGYRLAFRTSLKRLIGFPETFYSIPRVKVHRKDNLFVFWLHAAGFTGFAKQVNAHLRELTGYKENDTLKLYEQNQKTT